ncbi:hypothetical protein ACIA8O_20110 [Kitasatospora sp. NPDC051853]|uniref:hypothetical protein n=1 Tax=Kitasatospora sp. NPDC051853 TaxID=3364058 RepID=UPI0037AD7DFA
MSRTATVLLGAAVVVLAALMVAAGAGKLARLDGASWPAAVVRSGVAFAGTLTLAAVLVGAVVALL